MVSVHSPSLLARTRALRVKKAEDRTGTFRRGFLKLRLTQNSPESCIVFSNPSDAVLDIVFVHGFGGDRLGTWTSGEVCWPRQLLKSRLERARIISFGYEANVSQLLPSESHSLNSISECASELITSLVKLRANVPLRERALIFVVHSLGSTVVKEALCHSSSAPHQNSRAISCACKGVIFLGAAHREIWGESFGQIARNAALAVQPSLEPKILSALSEGCAVLKFDRINNAFLTFINAEINQSFKAITFYEEVVENRKVVVKRESARMDSPRHHLRRLNADHNSMCRFVHADDPIYMEVSAVIREFYDSVLKPQQIDCEVLYDGPDAVLDVVFVHSLGYGHSKTWTHNGVFWPKALLPADLPHARIIAYHYQTDFDAFQQDDQTVLCDHASQFLLSLINVRENLPCHQPSRSILFIAHATGGILVKQLLNISHLTKGQASMHAISMATRGVIFFGTAHQNDGSRGVGKIAAQSVRAGFPKLTNAVAKAIERDPSFEHINVAFQDFLEKGEHPLHLVSFYEKGRLLPQPIVPRNSVTLSIQQHTAQIPGTHALLGRFDTDEKQQYVMKQIRFIAGDAATGQDSPVINDQPELQQPETESAATLMADAEVPASATESASQILQPHIGHDALDNSRQREEEQSEDVATGQGSPVVHDQPESKRPETEAAALQIGVEVPASATESVVEILQPHIALIVGSANPVPCLIVAFDLLRTINNALQDVKASKFQLQNFGDATAVLLETLNNEYKAGRLSEAKTSVALEDLNTLLLDICAFVKKQAACGFLQSLLTKNERLTSIESHHRKLVFTVQAFNVVSLVNIQHWQQRNDAARTSDQLTVHKNLEEFKVNQQVLLETTARREQLDAMITSIHRHLTQNSNQEEETQFLREIVRYMEMAIRPVAGDATTGQDSPVIHNQPESQQLETESAVTLMADADVPVLATVSVSEIIQPLTLDALDTSMEREEEYLGSPVVHNQPESKQSETESAASDIDVQVPGSQTESVFSALEAVSATAVPCLLIAYGLVRAITNAIQDVKMSKYQLQSLGDAIKVLLETLNNEYKAGRLSEATTSVALEDLNKVLRDICAFVEKQVACGFLRSLLNKNERLAKIESHHRKLVLAVQAFNVDSLVNIQYWQQRNDAARSSDQLLLHKNLEELKGNQRALLETMAARRENLDAMIISIRRHLTQNSNQDEETKFLRETVRYMETASGRIVPIRRWTITSFEVEFEEKLTSGGFGDVWRGSWNGTQVALKVLKKDSSIRGADSTREIEVWSTLAHPHILEFLGANVLDDKPFIVMPYYRNGNARDYIQRNPDCDRNKILYHISLGLVYLHSQRVTHGDLKAVNVLIGEGEKAVLCDFGLSEVGKNATSRATGDVIIGSRFWMSPERLEGMWPEPPSDVYAFGMTTFEIYTNETPLADIGLLEFIERVTEGARPKRPQGDKKTAIPDGIWDLAVRCWAHEPSARPTANAVRDEVNLILQLASVEKREKQAGDFRDEVRSLRQEMAPLRDTEEAKDQDSEYSELEGLPGDLEEMDTKRIEKNQDELKDQDLLQ